MSSMGYQNVIFNFFDEQLQKKCSWECLGSSQDYKTWMPKYLSWKQTLEQTSLLVSLYTCDAIKEIENFEGNLSLCLFWGFFLLMRLSGTAIM